MVTEGGNKWKCAVLRIIRRFVQSIVMQDAPYRCTITTSRDSVFKNMCIMEEGDSHGITIRKGKCIEVRSLNK